MLIFCTHCGDMPGSIRGWLTVRWLCTVLNLKNLADPLIASQQQSVMVWMLCLPSRCTVQTSIALHSNYPFNAHECSSPVWNACGICKFLNHNCMHCCQLSCQMYAVLPDWWSFAPPELCILTSKCVLTFRHWC